MGRFQPFHRGHLELVRSVQRATGGRPLLLVIGSAEQAFTWENPFTAGERFEMISGALAEAGIPGVTIVPVADIGRHALWVRYLEGLLPRFDRVYTHNPLTRLLFERAGYAVESPPMYHRATLEGAKVRVALAAGRGATALLPPSVARYLAELKARERLLELRPSAGGRPRGAGT